MGVRFSTAYSNSGLGAPGAAGSEIVCITTPPLTQILDGAQVLIFWYLLTTVGLGTTLANVRLRRGTTTAGQLISSNFTTNVTAAFNTVFSGVYADSPGPVAGQQYSMTLAGAGTTGAWTPLDFSMLAIIL
jgi:hypothetical protein